MSKMNGKIDELKISNTAKITSVCPCLSDLKKQLEGVSKELPTWTNHLILTKQIDSYVCPLETIRKRLDNIINEKSLDGASGFVRKSLASELLMEFEGK